MSMVSGFAANKINAQAIQWLLCAAHSSPMPAVSHNHSQLHVVVLRTAAVQLQGGGQPMHHELRCAYLRAGQHSWHYAQFQGRNQARCGNGASWTLQ